MIHVGVSMGSDCINIEKQAFNTDYTLKDVNNQCPADLICIPNGKSTKTTRLNVDKICKSVNDKFMSEFCKMPCECSTDPGRFLY